MLTKVSMNEVLEVKKKNKKPRQILISEKAWLNRLIHISKHLTSQVEAQALDLEA